MLSLTLAQNNKNRLLLSFTLALTLHLALFSLITKKLSNNNIIANRAGQSIAINIAQFTSTKDSPSPKQEKKFNKQLVAQKPISKSCHTKAAAIESKSKTINTNQSQIANSTIAEIPVTSNFSVKGQRQIPQYPKRALRLKQEGVIYLRVLLSAEGVSEKIEFSQKSIYPLLNKAAIKAVKKWHFNPTIVKGKAVKSWVEIPIEFKIG